MYSTVVERADQMREIPGIVDNHINLDEEEVHVDEEEEDQQQEGREQLQE